MWFSVQTQSVALKLCRTSFSGKRMSKNQNFLFKRYLIIKWYFVLLPQSMFKHKVPSHVFPLILVYWLCFLWIKKNEQSIFVYALSSNFTYLIALNVESLIKKLYILFIRFERAFLVRKDLFEKNSNNNKNERKTSLKWSTANTHYL